MVAVGLCASFSGLAGLGLCLAAIEGGVAGPGFDLLMIGAAGLVGAVSPAAADRAARIAGGGGGGRRV